MDEVVDPSRIQVGCAFSQTRDLAIGIALLLLGFSAATMYAVLVRLVRR